MSASTTRAPSAAMSRAVASPRPLAAPVIATTLPATRPLTTPPQDRPPMRATTLAVLVTGAQPRARPDCGEYSSDVTSPSQVVPAPAVTAGWTQGPVRGRTVQWRAPTGTWTTSPG